MRGIILAAASYEFMKWAIGIAFFVGVLQAIVGVLQATWDMLKGEQTNAKHGSGG